MTILIGILAFFAISSNLLLGWVISACVVRLEGLVRQVDDNSKLDIKLLEILKSQSKSLNTLIDIRKLQGKINKSLCKRLDISTKRHNRTLEICKDLVFLHSVGTKVDNNCN